MQSQIFSMAPRGAFDAAQAARPLPTWTEEAAALPDGGVAPYDHTSFRSSASGLSVYTRHFQPDSTLQTPAARELHVFVFHGLAEHCSKYYYTHLAERFVAQGIAVHMADMQGHGYSESMSPRLVADAEHLISDGLQFVTETMRGAQPSALCAFVSFSTGAAVAIAVTASIEANASHALHRRVVGHYMMAPLVVSPYRTLPLLPSLIARFARTLSWVWPSALLMPYGTGIKPWVSFSSQKVFDLEVQQDALNWKGTYAVGTVSAIHALGLRVEPLAQTLATPFRVVKGECDGVLDDSHHAVLSQSPYASRQTTTGAAAVKWLWMIPGQPHCLIQSPEGDAVVADMEEWLLQELERHH